MTAAISLERRLASFRSARSVALDRTAVAPGRLRRHDRAVELATAIDAVVIETPRGRYVRCDVPPTVVPLDRVRLATLPGLPPADAPLVCLDTETTGLATAAGTIAFLVGVGWWEHDQFHCVQLVVPDQPDEPAMLEALAELLPQDAWLVTYNGRGFDWPLLEARFRMDGRPAPRHLGHLDLLPFVRRVFRHRLSDARLRTVERELLGIGRTGDVEGAEIPGRYLDYLQGGSPRPLQEVARHNVRDILSLAALLSHIDTALADPARRSAANEGDLVALAHLYRRERRHEEALGCLDAALGSGSHPPIVAERARTLRRLGRHAEALAAWRSIVTSGGSLTAVALVEIAKALEHTWSDPASALDVVDRGRLLAERGRSLGRPMPALEADLARRRRRLVDRLRRRSGGGDRAGRKRVRDPTSNGVP
ncbi:MAG: ribonuclease H-like domain-containing protein [Candidatus Limnocylindrales bacterium]